MKSCCIISLCQGANRVSFFCAQPLVLTKVTGYLKLWMLLLPTELDSQAMRVYRQAELHIHSSHTLRAPQTVFGGSQTEEPSFRWLLSGLTCEAGPAAHSWRLKSVGAEDAQHHEQHAGSLMKASLPSTLLRLGGSYTGR